jgi:hypothetical protein
MTPTLSDIAITPEILRDFLLANNLSETYIETKSMSDIRHPIENTDEFVWAHIKTFMAFRGGYYEFKFNNLDLFYAIVLPDYTNSEIIQLTSVLNFIDLLFNKEKHRPPTNSCSISVIKPGIFVVNSYFTIMDKVNKYSFKTKHTEFQVPDISFKTVYTALLVDLKAHIENYFGNELTVIDTAVFKSMLNETPQLYRDRLFSSSVTKPITKDQFKDSIEPVKTIILNDKIKRQNDEEAYYVNKDIFKNIDSDDNKYGFNFFISLSNISVLKTVLNKSMSAENIDLLIQNITMTAFYQNITSYNEKVTYIEFSRIEIGHLNKTEIARKDYFYSIYVGRDMFTLGMELGINIIHAPHCIRTESMQDLYQQQFNKITSKICGILDTDCNNVTVADLQVIDMALF